MSRIVLAGHGTSDPRGIAVLEGLHLAVAGRLAGHRVDLGWLSAAPPALEDVLGAAPVDVVVPLLLGSGYHVQVDIPALVAAQPDCIITEHLGPDHRVVQALAERLSDVDPDPVAVVLAAAGTSHPVGRSETRQAADMLAARLGVPVGVAYATGQGPDVETAIAAFRDAGADRVTVVPYLLAPGTFADRIAASASRTAMCCAAPLGDHPALVDLVVDRALGARQVRLDTAA